MRGLVELRGDQREGLGAGVAKLCAFHAALSNRRRRKARTVQPYVCAGRTRRQWGTADIARNRSRSRSAHRWVHRRVTRRGPSGRCTPCRATLSAHGHRCA
eukprot:scaffold52601_cov32-Tisochrysis_lutea.AAC.4